MKIIAITSQKGGVGKSTITCHLAHQLALKNKSVCLVDLDKQGTTKNWWNDRANVQNIEDMQYLGISIKEFINNIQRIRNLDFDYLIVDTPPTADENIEQVIELVDFVVVPAKASPNDLRAISLTLEVLKDKPFGFVINEARGSRLVEDTKKAMEQVGNVIAVIPSKVLVPETMVNGQLLSDITQHDVVVYEYQKIANYILENLKG